MNVINVYGEKVKKLHIYFISFVNTIHEKSQCLFWTS